MIDLQSHPEGIVLPVHAQPGAAANAIRGEHRGALKVAVTQIAEKGKANRSIIETLADSLCLKRSQIELLSGESQQQKKYLIRDIDSDELAQRIAAAL